MFRFEEAKYMAGTDGSWLMLKLKDITTIHKALRKISESKADSVEFEKFCEKRTNDANSYCWVLLTKLAEAIGEPKEIIYREQIRDIPQKPSRVLVKASDVEDEIKTWSKNGLGWYADIVGESTEHKGYVWIDRFKGSSQFNKKQMQMLIDNIIYECKEFDIETRTPEQIARLIDLWGEKHDV
jgi:hypothetical protein